MVRHFIRDYSTLSVEYSVAANRRIDIRCKFLYLLLVCSGALYHFIFSLIKGITKWNIQIIKKWLFPFQKRTRQKKVFNKFHTFGSFAFVQQKVGRGSIIKICMDISRKCKSKLAHSRKSKIITGVNHFEITLCAR